KEAEDLDNVLRNYLLTFSTSYDYKIESNRTLTDNICRVFLEAYQKTGKKIVILVDDYDAAILSENIDAIAREKYIERLKEFYKSIQLSQVISEFVFFTGTSFQEDILSEIDIFDISENSAFHNIAGFSQKEIKKLLIEQKSTLDAKEIFDWYSGYNFSGKDLDACSLAASYSVISALVNEKLQPYTKASCHIKDIMQTIYMTSFDITPLFTNLEVTADAFRKYIHDNANPLPALVQTGILAFKKASENTYNLFFPNKETKEIFIMEAVKRFSILAEEKCGIWAIKAIRALDSDSTEDFIELINSVTKNISSKTSKYIYTLLFAIMSLYTPCFISDSYFRIDTKKYSYLIAFSKESLQKALDKVYLNTYTAGNRKVKKMGLYTIENKVIMDFKCV
ncbi:MAG: AAA family ATPase, partial [Treponema sp.]|nr:AAA family ATPase [Treponema sp.]